MKTKVVVGIVVGAVVAALACVALIPTMRSKPVLHFYTWADYIKPELVEQFEREQGCRVVLDTFDSNETMYAKIKAGASGYDILTPTSYMVKLMNDQGLLQPIRRDLVPNMKNVDAEFLAVTIDKTMDHSVPYMLGNAGIAYRKDRVKKFEPSWTMFDRADLKGRMTMLNDMREALGGALKLLGYSLNTRDEKQLREARDVVIRWKKNLATFENEAYKSGIASGEFLVVHGYGGDLLQVHRENPNVVFALPREGYVVCCDDLVILKDAKNAELAHAFINFLHEPKVAAENSVFTRYRCPNSAAYPLLPDDLRTDPILFPPKDLWAKGEIILDLGADNAKYTKVWDEVKAAK